ncbi:hypothetical protein BC834DRAFT_920699 [Gloeopeniophorella convolvens]|nr:hypothetical protein BC834DRAFT_920699 [Gloeopeniophorella convolvens]
MHSVCLLATLLDTLQVPLNVCVCLPGFPLLACTWILERRVWRRPCSLLSSRR